MASLEVPPILLGGEGPGVNYEQEEEEEDGGEILPAPSSWFVDDNSSSENKNKYTFDSDALEEVFDYTDDEEQERPVTPPFAMPSPSEARVRLSTTPPSALQQNSYYAPAYHQPSPPPRRQTSAVSSVSSNSNSSNVVALPSPSWKEISSEVLPCAARELLSSSMQRIYHTARLSYARGRWQRQYTELGNNAGGYVPSERLLVLLNETSCTKSENQIQLPHFSSLPWVDRQMVEEWRTWWGSSSNDGDAADTTNEATLQQQQAEEEEEEVEEFDRARNVVPTPAVRPIWQRSEACASCHKTFGPTRLRHHCRLCGSSFCQAHSACTHSLVHLGYVVPERVCDGCKRILLEHNLAERVAWRLARCRDHVDGNLTPYFETGVDTLEKVALRITQGALAMARSIPLGAQATVAVETVDVLRKYGLNGIYTIMLRQEFLAAADLLRKALGINRTAWPLSVHELSAAIFYALAQHRAVRGLNPDGEHLIHTLRKKKSPPRVAVDETAVLENGLEEGTEKLYSGQSSGRISDLVSATTTTDDASSETSSLLANLDTENDTSNGTRFQPVCDPVPDEVLQSLIFYAPLALNFVYAEKEVDMQLLAAQQGWRLLYAHLDHLDKSHNPGGHADLPASALFVHDEHKILCLSIRGTTTISDVVTDLRQVAVSFPDYSDAASSEQDEWTSVRGGQGIAVCGMSQAAVNLYRENIDSIMFYANRGYRIRVVGHSLGGGVSALLGILIQRDLAEKNLDANSDKDKTMSETEENARLRVYAYGSPSCVDRTLSEFVESFVVTVVLHDDVVPRLTPTSCRGLLKYLLHIRETWVKDHLPDDIMAITDRAKSAWAPRWRGSFTLPTSSSSIKRYYRKHIQYGKKTLLSVREKIVGDESGPLFSISEADNDAPENQIPPTDSHARQQSEDDVSQSLVLDYMGGLDVTAAVGLVIEGDEFFDAGTSLLEEEEDDEDGDSLVNEEYEHGSVVVDSNGCDSSTSDGIASGGTSDVESETDDDEAPAGAVVLEETPLHRMYLPGKIVHMYSHCGVYKAAYVPRDFRELRRISPAGNMLSDHKCKPYYEALLEVRSVRRAAEAPPRWVAFDCDDTCSCCASRFTWASTSDSKAQEARDKHNCRSCGTLVCDPCSRNRVPLPSIGLTVAARVCDRCYNDMDGVFTGPTESSGNCRGADAHGTAHELSDDGLPVRQRVRRSAVVDDLAARVQTTPMTCS